jgi:hypothetical protein
MLCRNVKTVSLVLILILVSYIVSGVKVSH